MRDKMASKQPVIKFSPFEALLIGEKNRILKRQPMKNTIFVTTLNRRRKTINLRDLFGLDNSTKTNSDTIFKMPQRVCDFLKHKKLRNDDSSPAEKDSSEVLCYEYEGYKMLTRNNAKVMLKGKNKKEKLRKVKFKKKFRRGEKFRDKVVKKFAKPIRRNYYFDSKSKCLALKKKNLNAKRHTLRGSDGKFIRKSEYDKGKSKEISPKQKYLSNYLHQLYLRNNKKLFNDHESNREEINENYEMPYSIKTIVGLPNARFDITASEATLNEVSKRFYKCNCLEDFQFPKFPKQLKPLDFENDKNLVDVIYENFPVVIKFESTNNVNDFTDTLLDRGIIKPEQSLKIYDKKKNGFIKEEEFSEIFGNRFPLIRLKRVSHIVPEQYSNVNNTRKYESLIDEPYTTKSHLITGKSFGSFFFRSAEGKDIFIGNLMKPYLQNSCFGRLPDI